MADNNHYLMLTGATGLLGRSLLRDLAAAGRRIAVLVRPGKGASAVQRIDELLLDWQEVAAADVPFPVVLAGDITQSGLGLTHEETEWVAQNVDELIHSAASLSFQKRESDGEPYRSNVDGTANVLEFCRTTGIRRLHHVSSAYVCGLREGRILESELDVGQTPGNDYERSKIVSETAAREAGHIETCTVHRPSIIVGDLLHGFTNTFHGFYKPLRIVQPFVEAFMAVAVESSSLLGVLGMTGDERKNLVPVDWVSAVMTRIIQDQTLHGQTYHLTSTHPTPVSQLYDVFASLVAELAEQARRSGGAKKASGFDPSSLAKLFGDQMHVYRAYWRDDPVFDSTSTHHVAADLPSPVLDDEAIRRLCRFAIKHSFHWPPVARSVVVPDARGLLEQRLGQARWKSDVESDQRFGLATVGPGGGQWTLCCQSNRPVELLVGLPSDNSPVVWASSQVVEQLLAEESAPTPARLHGAVTVEGGDEQQRQHVLEMVSRLSECISAGGKPLQPR
ncbi:MAG: SDR family oxidoreductase [Pirellulales bacterium]